MPSKENDERKEIVQKVNDFVERLHNNELQISSDASKKTYRISRVGFSDVQPLSDLLADALENYESSKVDKQTTDEDRFAFAKILLHWIGIAYSNGLVKNNDISKMKENEQKRTELEAELGKLYNRNAMLEAQCNQLEERIKTFYDHCPRCGFSWNDVEPSDYDKEEGETGF